LPERRLDGVQPLVELQQLHPRPDRGPTVDTASRCTERHQHPLLHAAAVEQRVQRQLQSSGERVSFHEGDLPVALLDPRDRRLGHPGRPGELGLVQVALHAGPSNPLGQRGRIHVALFHVPLRP